MFSGITETFLILLYVFVYNRNIFRLIICFRGQSPHIFSQFWAVSTIFCRKFATYNNQISLILFITMTKFTQICALQWTNFPYFVHYVDHIYPDSGIVMTRFPQSTENTYICGIQFQISPNFCGFGNDL